MTLGDPPERVLRRHESAGVARITDYVTWPYPMTGDALRVMQAEMASLLGRTVTAEAFETRDLATSVVYTVLDQEE